MAFQVFAVSRSYRKAGVVQPDRTRERFCVLRSELECRQPLSGSKSEVFPGTRELFPRPGLVRFAALVEGSNLLAQTSQDVAHALLIRELCG